MQIGFIYRYKRINVIDGKKSTRWCYSITIIIRNDSYTTLNVDRLINLPTAVGQQQQQQKKKKQCLRRKFEKVFLANPDDAV